MNHEEKIEKCAIAAHNILVLYYKLNRNFTLKDWDEAPQWQKESTVALVQSVIDGTYSPRKEHERWYATKVEAGYVWGPEKNDDKEKGPLTNPDLKDFGDLPVFSKMKSVIQIAAILGTAANYDIVVSKVPDLIFV